MRKTCQSRCKKKHLLKSKNLTTQILKKLAQSIETDVKIRHWSLKNP